jgi:hypothetical protein
LTLAGAGRNGSSDEVGYPVGDNKVTIYDFPATVLRRPGLDPKRLTSSHNGIRRRLTDVRGAVIEDILA